MLKIFFTIIKGFLRKLLLKLSFFILRVLKRPLLKVGIIYCFYPAEGSVPTGGASIYTYNLVEKLAELGCEVHVFTKGNKDKDSKRKIGNGKIITHVLNIDVVNTEDQVVLRRLSWYAFEVKALNKVIYENSKRKFDIIHTQHWPATAFMLKHFNGTDLNWVHTFHSFDKKRLRKMTKEESKLIPIHEWLDRTVVDADRLIAASNKLRMEVIREFKGVAKKAVVIPNGVDLEKFKPAENSPLTVLYIGRFSKEKGIELIPEIAEEILEKNKKYKFIAVAEKTEFLDLPELKEIEEKLIELEEKYKDRFIWIFKPLSEQEIAELYHEAGVYMQPSFYENMPLCILEAMACGKAIVATRVGGIPELLSKVGLLAKPDAKEIAKKALRLLKSSKLRKKYGELAAEKAKEFSWENIAKQTFELYQDVIREKKEDKEDKKTKQSEKEDEETKEDDKFSFIKELDEEIHQKDNESEEIKDKKEEEIRTV